MAGDRMKLFTKESLERLALEEDIMSVIKLYFSNLEYCEGDEFTYMPCPFHENDEEEYPFLIRRNKYCCFECGAKGDTVQFLMNYKKWKFDETIEFLAKLWDVKLERC
jgi:DNA primase